jgi:transcriptional regulator with XRE-family HTH domain
MEKKKPNPIDVLVGSRVRMRRLMLGLSQEKLGERLGLTFQQVQKYEKGSNRVGASRLVAISEVLNVAPSLFFQDDSTLLPKGTTIGETDELASFVKSSEGVALNRAFAKIKNLALRKKVIALTEALAGQADDPDMRALEKGEDTAPGHRL